MKLTVAIPTLGRDIILLDTLRSLESQTFEDYEIIIVSQSKVEDSELLTYIENNPQISLYEQLDKKGASAGRNLCAKKAKGEILLYIDDDIIPLANDFFQAHIDNYLDKNIVGVVGKVVVDDGTIPYDPRGVGQITRTGEFIDNWMSDERAEIRSGISCNLSVLKKIYEEVNGFDENFLPGMREDSDFTMRVTRKYKMVYDPKAGVHHLKAKIGGGENRGEMEDKQNKKEARIARLNWYRKFFHNEMLIVLKHLNPIFVPIFIFRHKLRPILACMFWYGKGSPKALVTPLLGMIDGYKTYRMEVKTKSKWL